MRRIGNFLILSVVVFSILFSACHKREERYYGERAKNPEAEEWLIKGRDYIDSGEYEKAFECFNKAIEIEPTFMRPYGFRGMLQSKFGNFNEAISDINTVLRAYPDSAPAYYMRALIHMEFDMYNEAIGDLSKVIYYIERIDLPIWAEELLYAYGIRGGLYFELGEYEKALEDLNIAIEFEPKNSDLLNKMGLVYFKLNENNAAVLSFNKAIDLEPNEPYYYYNRSKAYTELKKFDEALEDINKAITINQDDPGFYNQRDFINDNLENIKKR